MKNALHNLHSKRKLKMGTKTIKLSVCICECGRESLCFPVCECILSNKMGGGREGRIDDDTTKIFVEMR